MHSGAGDFSLGASVTIPYWREMHLTEQRFRLMALIAWHVSGMEDTLLEGDEAFDAMITGTDQSAVGASVTIPAISGEQRCRPMALNAWQ